MFLLWKSLDTILEIALKGNIMNPNIETKGILVILLMEEKQ
jgi:hypothetical protein